MAIKEQELRQFLSFLEAKKLSLLYQYHLWLLIAKPKLSNKEVMLEFVDWAFLQVSGFLFYYLAYFCYYL